MHSCFYSTAHIILASIDMPLFLGSDRPYGLLLQLSCNHWHKMLACHQTPPTLWDLPSMPNSSDTELFLLCQPFFNTLSAPCRWQCYQTWSGRVIYSVLHKKAVYTHNFYISSIRRSNGAGLWQTKIVVINVRYLLSKDQVVIPGYSSTDQKEYNVGKFWSQHCVNLFDQSASTNAF